MPGKNFVDGGPAVGKDGGAPKNEALSTGPDHEYRKDSTPGTADHAKPQHAAGGPGHANCDHE